MKKIIISVICIFSFWCKAVSQPENTYMVYSVKGDIKLNEKGILKPLKTFDQLTLKQVLVLKPASKLSYIKLKDKSYHESDRQGTFTVAQLVAAEKNEAGTMGKAFGYIADNFIEKGKMMQEKMSYKDAGVVERGLDPNPLIFPFNNTVIYQTLGFVPIFNASMAKMSPEFSLTVKQGDHVLQNMNVKEGDTVNLDKRLNQGNGVVIVAKWRQRSNEVNLVLPGENDRITIDKELREITKTAASLSPEMQLLTKALFFEDNKCYIEALSYYDRLEKMSGKNEKYVFMRNQFIQSHSTTAINTN